MPEPAATPPPDAPVAAASTSATPATEPATAAAPAPAPAPAPAAPDASGDAPKRLSKKERRAAKTQAANGGAQPDKPRFRPDGTRILSRKERLAADEAAAQAGDASAAAPAGAGAGAGAPPTAAAGGEASSHPAGAPAPASAAPAAAAGASSVPAPAAARAAPGPPGRTIGPAEQWSTSLLSNVVRPKPDRREESVLKQVVLHVRYHPSMILLRDRLDPNKAGNEAMGKVHAELNGSNLRAIAVLEAMKEMIGDYRTPPKTLFSRTLIVVVGAAIDFLTEVRPMGISVANSIRFLKAQISVLDRDFDDQQSKVSLFKTIDEFIRERIVVPQKVITRLLAQKIKPGATVLVYGHSTTVEQALLRIHARARAEGKAIKVIVIESGPPMHQSKDFVMMLHKAGVEDVTYGHLSALTRLMPRAEVVLLGAAAVLADGALYARAGTSVVAMYGHECEKPVYAACETYKFSERLQMDALVENEAGHPDEFLPHGTGKPARSQAFADQPGVLLSRGAKAAHPHLHTLALRYDITPAQFVSAIVCEAGFFQPESAPSIMRDYKSILFGA